MYIQSTPSTQGILSFTNRLLFNIFDNKKNTNYLNCDVMNFNYLNQIRGFVYFHWFTKTVSECS